MSLSSLSPWDKHIKFIAEYKLIKDKGCKSDYTALREAYQFVGSSGVKKNDEWGSKLAEAYCRRLFKEYALVDLSFYKQGKIGMRWRVEAEVTSGKGQFHCGAISCLNKVSLITLEVPFRYVEQKIKKEALVKVRLCSQCNQKMQYHHLVKKNRRLGIEPPPDIVPVSEPIKEGPAKPVKMEKSKEEPITSVKRPKLEPAASAELLVEPINVNQHIDDCEAKKEKETKEDDVIVKEEEEATVDREAEQLAWAPKPSNDGEKQIDEFDDFLAEMFP